MRRHRKTVPRYQFDAALLLTGALLVALTGGVINNHQMEARAAQTIEYPKVTVRTVTVKVDDPDQNIDSYVGRAVDEFFTGHLRSEARMIMHCLLHRESGHAASNKRGDGGLAIGPMQFQQETWNRMRGQMIKAGLATDISSPENLEQSIRTTAWALKNGRGREWGPIYRELKGSDFATCPAPSWSKEGK